MTESEYQLTHTIGQYSLYGAIGGGALAGIGLIWVVAANPGEGSGGGLTLSGEF